MKAKSQVNRGAARGTRGGQRGGAANRGGRPSCVGGAAARVEANTATRTPSRVSNLMKMFENPN